MGPLTIPPPFLIWRGCALIVILSGQLFFGSTTHALGRPITAWTYPKLTEAADLIVIAQSLSTTDAKKTDKPGQGLEGDFVGVDTTFRILCVLKGQYKEKEFTLFHYRESTRPEGGPTPDIDGPLLVSFDCKDAKDQEYLLYLKKRRDGRYECVSGDVDPLLSVRRINNPFPILTPGEPQKTDLPKKPER
jgi:hypothetical protein